jgi:hypothetical protein
MIEFNIEPNTLVIETIDFIYEGVHIKGITVRFLQVRDYADDNNIGKILEKFRKFKETRIEPDKYEHMMDLINNVETNLDGFQPSHIITIKSHHQEITNLTNMLNYNILLKNNIYPEDVSECFLKNSEKSITKYETATDDFLEEYSLNKRLLENKYFERLLIVDDVIKKGRVINQLLIRLTKNGNIDSNTKIFIYTIYSFKIIQ